MISTMRKYNISICGIQEHRKVKSADREQEINRYDVDSGYNIYIQCISMDKSNTRRKW